MKERAMMKVRTPERQAVLDAYTDACRFPGLLDEQRVEESLRRYVGALGLKLTEEKCPARG